MDNEKKKSRLIRLLGKLGGKVRFLRKPLMVITVVCVSIHHLIRQLFFDVKYHTARMRLITGAMCVALLFTLFVIPAIADEVFEIGTEIEILDSEEPTAEPVEQAPIIENEQPEEPTANQAEPEYDNDDHTYDDQTDSNDGQGDANAPTADTSNNNANDGVTYDVDDEGNLIDPETGEKVKNNTIAARRMDDSPTTIPLPNVVANTGTGYTSGTSKIISYGDNTVKMGVVATSNVNTTDSEAADYYPDYTPIFTYRWTVKVEGYTEQEITDATNPDFTIGNAFYNSDAFKTPFKAGKRIFEFNCKVTERGANYKTMDTPIKVTINKKELTVDDFLGDSSGNGRQFSYGEFEGTNTLNKYVTDGGVNIPDPVLKNGSSLKGDISLKYKFIATDNTEYSATPINGQKGTYNVYVHLESADFYTTSSDQYLDKTLVVDYYTLPAGTTMISVNKRPNTTTGWYNDKVTLSAGTNLEMCSTVDGTYVDKYEYDTQSSAHTIPSTLYFNYKQSSTEKYPLENPIQIADIKAAFVDYDFNGTNDIKVDALKPTATVTILDASDTGYYSNSVKFQVSDPKSNLKSDGTSDNDGSTITLNDNHVWYAVTKNATAPLSSSTTDWTGYSQAVTKDLSGDEFASANKVYIHVKLKDDAGNENIISEKFITVDKEKPTFKSKSSGTDLAENTSGEPYKYYIAVGSAIDPEYTKKIITVTDNVGIKTINKGSGEEAVWASDRPLVTTKDIELSPPGTGESQNYKDYEITVKDLAGNTSKIYVNVYRVDADINVAESSMVLGDDVQDHGGATVQTVKGKEYGYSDEYDSDPKMNAEIKLVRNGTLTDNLEAKIYDAKLQGGSTSNFIVAKGDDGKWKVKPKTRLKVGTYNDTILVKYHLLSADAEPVYESTATVSVTFKVVKAPLTVTYMGNTEYFHAKADFTPKDGDEVDTEDTDTDRIAEAGTPAVKIATKVSGFKYGEGKTIKTDDNTYADPTMPGIGTRHNLAPDAEKQVTPTGGTAANYYFSAYNPGTMKCVRRTIEGSYDLLGQRGENDWFTGLVVFKPKSGYTLYDVSNDNAKKASYLPDATLTDEGGNTVTNTDAYNAADYKSEGMYFIDETKGIKKQFYVYNTATEEISSLMETQEIKIDLTAPHQRYTHEDGSVTTDTGEMGYMWDGKKVDTKSDRPYLRVDASDPWGEFWHILTLGLYFNARTTVVVENAKDDISGIQSVDYYVADKTNGDYVDQSKRDVWEGSGIESIAEADWQSVSLPDDTGQTDFKVDEEVIKQAQIDEGFLYVRIKNNAGLVTYLTIHRVVIFDSEGPSITTSVKPTNRISSPNTEGKYVVASADEFIAEEVQFTIHDTNLHKATAEKPEHSVVVYEGYNISDSGTIVSDAVSPTGSCVYDNPNKEQSWTVTLKCGHHNDPQCKEASSRNYTIVARDDSGFETIRYFTITKPVYDIEVDKVVVPAAVYGYTAASLSPQQLVQKPKDQETGAGWRNTSAANADAIIENMEYTQGGENFETIRDGDRWIVKPKTGLPVNNYSATLKVTYKDTDGEHKTAPKTLKTNVFFNVLPKVLTATYEGGTILRGKTSDASKNVKVTGFIEGEDATNASGYKAPVVNIPSGLKQTTIIKPEGGSADNYRFEYVGGILTVVSREAEKNTHYTVSGTMSSTGWYTSNITLTPKSGYVMTSDADGKLTMPNIVITEDTAYGDKRFYIKENKDNGEIYNQTVFNYRKDTIAPVISGVIDGLTYKANKKEVTVTDANLARVSVNGVAQDVTQGKSTFNLLATQKEKLCFIVAEDCAGHITSATVTLLQEDGTDDPGLEDDLDDDPDDDRIQDDTDGGDDGDLGSFTKKVQLVDGAPATTFTSSNKELKNYVLNTSEREVLREGSDVNVKLRVQNIDGSVSQADKELVIAALGDYTVAKYLDVTLWKTVGSGEEVGPIAKTKKAISMTVTIPSEFRKAVKSGKVREFAFVRVHNGAAAVLEDQDGSANTITVSSSLYSVYALAYRDVDASSAKSHSDSGGGGKSKSDGTSNGAGRSGRGSGSGSGNGSGGGSGSGSGGGYGSVRTNGVSVETDGIIDGSPQTGDRAPILPTALGFGLSFIGMITVLVLRKKFDYEWVYVDDAGNYYDRKGNPVDSSMYEDV